MSTTSSPISGTISSERLAICCPPGISILQRRDLRVERGKVLLPLRELGMLRCQWREDGTPGGEGFLRLRYLLGPEIGVCELFIRNRQIALPTRIARIGFCQALTNGDVGLKGRLRRR